MKNGKLEINDKLCFITYNSWNKQTYYKFETVVRLTKTQAVLYNGDKLINREKTDFNNNPYFMEYGNSYNKWVIETPKLIFAAKQEKQRIFINNWIEKKKFTDEEKLEIYIKYKEDEHGN